MQAFFERLVELIPGNVVTVGVLEKLFELGYRVVGIIVIARLGVMVGDFFIRKVFRPRSSRYYYDERRANTLRTLLKSILRYAAYFFVGLGILQELMRLLNTDIKTFLAGAGIIGVALSFGAQSLVKDVVTGFFILLENQYAVGEYIKTGQYSGFVEEVGLRATKLRDWGGELHVIPNGMLDAVTNYSRGSLRALVEVGIAYEEDIDRAIEVMNKTVAEVAAEFKDVIVEGPEVLGVVAFGPSEVIIRTVAKTKPMEQWRIERELRKRFKEAFDREGIEIPYPKQVYISKNEGVTPRKS